MQSHDWNDLKYLLALHRTTKLNEAGRIVGVSATTVARRIKAFEQEIGVSLFLRSAAGRYEPTEAALQLLRHAEAVELENLAIREKSVKNTGHVTGNVRVSSVPIIVNCVLVPNLDSLLRKHPQLTIELVPASANLDLSKREADLAVRFARPIEGGLRTNARKLGELRFGAYMPNSIAPDNADALGWISYDDAHSDLPQARWLRGATASSTETKSCLIVSDAETALEAVANGLGKTLLPEVIADADPRLRAHDLDCTDFYPIRDVWLLSHVDQTARPSVMATKQWLTDLDWNLGRKR